MSTITDHGTGFVVKSSLTPEALATLAVVRTPEGENLGGTVVTAINITA